LVLATSRGLSRFYVPAPEEAPFLHPSMGGDENGQVRAEMVFYEGPNGGAVFSTGSITWAASLGYNNCDNNVSRITRNVLERFLDETSFV
jgi:N,N-dimethylformamidase